LWQFPMEQSYGKFQVGIRNRLRSPDGNFKVISSQDRPVVLLCKHQLSIWDKKLPEVVRF
jgi:hypothetical protein